MWSDSVSGASKAMMRASTATARMMRSAVELQHRDANRVQRCAGEHKAGEPVFLVQAVAELGHANSGRERHRRRRGTPSGAPHPAQRTRSAPRGLPPLTKI